MSLPRTKSLALAWLANSALLPSALFFRALALGVIATIATDGRAASVDEVLKGLDASFHLLSNAEFRVDTNQFIHERGMRRELHAREGRWLCRRDGNRWKLSFEGLSRFLDSGAISERKQAFEYVIPQTGSILATTTNGQLDYITARIDAGERERNAMYFEDDFMFVFGHLQGQGTDSYLPDLVRRSTATLEDGTEAVVLNAVGPYGTIKITCRRANGGYLPTQVMMEKKGNDRLGAKPVNQYEGLQQVSLNVTTDELQSVDGVELWKSFRVEWARRYSNRTDTQRSISTIHAVNLHPDVDAADAFAVVRPIPNGHQVIVEDRPNVYYEWIDSKIVKKIDTRTQSFLQRQTYFGGIWAVRYWFAACNALILAVLLAIWFKTTRSK